MRGDDEGIDATGGPIRRFDGCGRLPEPMDELPPPDLRAGAGVVAQSPECEIEHPVAFVLVGVRLEGLVSENAPVPGSVAHPLVVQRGEDLEAFASPKMTTAGESGCRFRVAPEQEPLRTDTPQLVKHAVGPRVAEQVAISVSVVG